MIASFAVDHEWAAYMRVFFDRGIEIFVRQADLWARIRELYALPGATPLPTPGLAAALEWGILLAVTPEEYMRVAPEYGSSPEAYQRLLAHEVAHRLHVSILGGDEDAMGPLWFYEGFAVVASGDLTDPPRGNHTWEALIAPGPQAYRRYGALLRRLMERIPLSDLVDRARAHDFEQWARSVFLREQK
jgi:hypothetical protein